MNVTNWADLFQTWVPDLPRRGILITSWNEQIPFDGFLVNPAFLVAFRQTPDSLGARTVIMAFDDLSAVKLTDVVKPKAFQSLGFEGVLPKR